jgi:hypothetical protein
MNAIIVSNLGIERHMLDYLDVGGELLMWKRLLKPELALSFWGIFECVIMPESDWGCYYIGVGDEADDHVNKWLTE